MKYSRWLLALMFLLMSMGMTSAQYPYGSGFGPGAAPYAKPPVSPYLNLLRQGNSPAFNYSTLVRPQLQFQQGMQGLQNQFGTLQQSVTTLEQQGLQGPPVLPATGHPTGFMTHRAYFMNLAGAGATGTPGAGAGLGELGAAGTGFGGAGLKTGGATKKR
jgi:hypothetical protein